MTDDWPLDKDTRRRTFESKHFTLEELTKKQQENEWLRNRDAEDGIYTEYPTHDYSYNAYECFTIDELRKAFLYGNWAIRQCFTYKNLAFINQINAGDEWWVLKKFEDGVLLAFESVTMVAVINHEKMSWIQDSNPQDPLEARRMSIKFHEENPEYANKKARYVIRHKQPSQLKDKSKFSIDDVGIYFIDIAEDYFPEYIEQMLNATHQQCASLEYTSEEFKKKWNR